MRHADGMRRAGRGGRPRTVGAGRGGMTGPPVQTGHPWKPALVDIPRPSPTDSEGHTPPLMRLCVLRHTKRTTKSVSWAIVRHSTISISSAYRVAAESPDPHCRRDSGLSQYACRAAPTSRRSVGSPGSR